jgi:polyferredoxin
MDKMDYPRGLVRYTTENALEGKKAHVLRPRIIIYGLLLLLIASAVFYSILNRVPLELDIIRDRNALYRETSNGLVENIYTLKVINMDKQTHRYRLTIDGPEKMSLHMRDETILVPSGEVVQFPVQLQIDPVYLEKAGYDIQFHLQAMDQPELQVNETGRFIGPVMR